MFGTFLRAVSSLYATDLQKKTPTQVFFKEFSESFQINLFTEYFRATTSRKTTTTPEKKKCNRVKQ